jgi:hypothetical protein
MLFLKWTGRFLSILQRADHLGHMPIIVLFIDGGMYEDAVTGYHNDFSADMGWKELYAAVNKEHDDGHDLQPHVSLDDKHIGMLFLKWTGRFLSILQRADHLGWIWPGML